MNIVVTGAGGFIGSRLIQLANVSFNAQPLSLRNKNVESIDVTGADAIVHLAGKAHEMKKTDDQSFYDINYILTKNLAEKAIAQHVPHFIYVSSLKVYGDETDKILNENSACNPTDAYGKSKLMAEEYLKSLQNTKIKVAIVRPPLVYGAAVKGNMLRLLSLCSKNIPLPFANTKNSRSIVFVDNLVELIFSIIRQQATGIFLASDNQPLPTDALLALIQQELNNKIALFSMPSFLRNVLKKIKPELYNRLFNSFVVNCEQTNKKLHFKPSYNTDEGIAEMVKWYKTLEKNL